MCLLLYLLLVPVDKARALPIVRSYLCFFLSFATIGFISQCFFFLAFWSFLLKYVSSFFFFLSSQCRLIVTITALSELGERQRIQSAQSLMSFFLFLRFCFVKTEAVKLGPFLDPLLFCCFTLTAQPNLLFLSSSSSAPLQIFLCCGVVHALHQDFFFSFHHRNLCLVVGVASLGWLEKKQKVKWLSEREECLEVRARRAAVRADVCALKLPANVFQSVRKHCNYPVHCLRTKQKQT